MPRYFQVDYDKGSVVEYERKGECSGCGDCCRATIRLNGIPMDPTTSDARDGGYCTNGEGRWNMVLQDNLRPVWFRFKPIDASTIPTHRCPVLVDDQASGLPRCGIYQVRAKVCSTWPTSPDQVEALPNCSYTFRTVAEYTLEEFRAQFGQLDLPLNAVELTLRRSILREFYVTRKVDVKK